MPSLHKVLKFKAGVRATTAQARLFPAGIKNENQKLRRGEKQPASRSSSTAPEPSSSSSPSSPTSSRPSFVNSFVSSFSSSASSASPASSASSAASSDAGGVVLDLRHGKDTGLTVSESISRAVSTPSVHRPLRQSSQPLIFDANEPEWAKGFAVKVMFVNSPNGRTEDVLLHKAAAIKGGNSGNPPRDKVSPKGHLKDSGNNGLSALRNEVWKEKQWRALGAEVREDSLRRESLAELDKNSVSSIAERVEHSDNMVRNPVFSQEDPVDNEAARAVFKELSIAQELDTICKVSGWNLDKNAIGLQPLRNLSLSGNVCTDSTITSRPGCLFGRALHDASLAGEGVPLDRSSENASNVKVQHSASDGKSLKLVSGACNLPHPEKVKTGGEDAYFICPDKQVFGVADGVGGWADLGIDAGEYARELMAQSLNAVQQEPAGSIDPARVMEKAHSLTKCKGSSTACIIALTDSALEAANLGDSGFVIVRNSRTIFKSPVQQHQFNIPFQLEHGGSDPPSAAQVFSFQVFQGDVVVAGTDGLFDNVYDSELTTVVVQAVRGGLDPQKTAEKIAALAKSRAQDKNRQTPFSTAAQDAGFRFYGGKMDDITVIVSYITSTKSTAARL
ncbi:unnamed protein product [Calypogeia fissa]